MSQETIDRWNSFVTKVEARLEQIVGESREAFADVARVDPLDGGPIASIEMALQSRLRRIDDKVDDAFDTARDELDEEPIWDEICDTKRDLQDRLLVDETVCKVEALGDLGRTMQQLAGSEDNTRRCQQCGNSFDAGVLHQAKNCRCASCDAVNAVRPGRASAEFYQRGVTYLANAEALEAWKVMHQAERAFEALRHPGTDEYNAFEEGYRAYWKVWYDVQVRLHPGWSQAQADAELEGVIAKFRFRHRDHYLAQMQIIASGLKVASKRNIKAVQNWASQAESDNLDLLDDLLEAAVERASRPAADTLVRMVHADDMPWIFGRQRWVRAKLRELSPAFA